MNEQYRVLWSFFREQARMAMFGIGPTKRRLVRLWGLGEVFLPVDNALGADSHLEAAPSVD